MLVFLSYHKRPDYVSPVLNPAKEDSLLKSNNIDLELKEIQLQNEKVDRKLSVMQQLIEELAANPATEKAYYNVEECAQMKGAASILSYKGNRFMLPGCGNPKFCVHILGRLAFPAPVVKRWLEIPDEEYLDYARNECGVTIIPPKYAKMASRGQLQKGE